MNENSQGAKRDNTTRPPAYIRRKRKRKLRGTGAQNRTAQATTSRNTTKRTPIAANCLEKAVKRKPQAEERQNKKPLPRAHREKGHRLRHGRDKVPQHQQKVPGSEQPADHQRLLRYEETPRFCLNHMQRKKTKLNS